jgi:hypothetical protein
MGIALPPPGRTQGGTSVVSFLPWGIRWKRGGVRPENDPLSKKISRLQNENFGKNRHKIH